MRPLILLTNDDGVRSPGLWAVAAAIHDFADFMVVAPHDQYTSIGRALPAHTTGRATLETFQLDGQEFTGYGLDASPAQAVQYALYELLPRRPDLVISGINYGDNVGNGVTISGTVSAAMEAAAHGVPALAVSRETDPKYFYSHSDEVDFGVAAHFARRFARAMLASRLPFDVDVLKVEVPENATPATPWRFARQSRALLYHTIPPQRPSPSDPAPLRSIRKVTNQVEPGSDIDVTLVQREVAVTPLSIDLTARVSWEAMHAALNVD